MGKHFVIRVAGSKWPNIIVIAVFTLVLCCLTFYFGTKVALGELLSPRERENIQLSPSLSELQSYIDTTLLKRHVYDLASQEMKGRDVGSDEGMRAISYIENEFRTYGLKPWFNGHYQQPIRTGQGANIAAFIEGADPQHREEIVILSAHHDHLGVREGLIYPGADDNISSVSLMLEIARVLSKYPQVLKRSVLFVSFDAEEKPEGGTEKMGSMYFLNQLSTSQRRNIVLMIGMDLMAGEITAGLPGTLFVVGSEKSQRLSRLIKTRYLIDKLHPLLLSLSMVEAVPYCPWCTRPVSDYDSFRKADIPFIFLSTGRTKNYHTPDDTPGSLHYEKLVRNAAYVLDLTLGASNELARIDDYNHVSKDWKMDIEVVERLLSGLLKTPPQNIYSGNLKTLQDDQVTLSALNRKSDNLSWYKYRKLQNVLLRMQCIAARASWRICKWL